MFKSEEAATLLVIIMISLLLEQIKLAETLDFLLLRSIICFLEAFSSHIDFQSFSLYFFVAGNIVYLNNLVE